MPDQSELPLEATPVSSQPHRRRRETVIFLLIIILFLGFAFKVFSYYRQLQTGTFDASKLSFQSTSIAQSKLVEIARAAPGSGALATSDDPSLGPSDAKLTIVEFADFGCPYSEQENYVVRALAKQFPDDVRIIYRDFPIVDLHPGADLAAEAGGCANEQGKFWEYHDVLYRHSGQFESDQLIDYASEVGLNISKFRTCLESGKYTDEVAQDIADGVAAGVTGTPTFYLNGEKIEGAVPFATFVDLVHVFLGE